MKRLALALVVLLVALTQGGASAGSREGGSFRVSFTLVQGFDLVDPALAYSRESWAVLDTVGRLGVPDEPWDLALVLWTPDFVDPSGYVNRLLDPQQAGTNLPHFDERESLELMRSASRLRGDARRRAYAALDLKLGLEAAPVVPVAVLNEATFVSARTGCLLRRPGLVLTTVCLRSSRR